MATSRLKLVFDEQFSHRHVGFVNHESGLGEITHTRGMGWSGKPDKDWMPHAIKAGFVIVTADRNEKTREYTVADLKSLRARVILVGPFWDHWGAWQKAKWLVQSIERICKIASGMAPGSVTFLVDRYCKVRDL